MTLQQAQAHTGNGFDDGFKQAKHDLVHTHVYNASCTVPGVYCKQYISGYQTEWIQAHWSTGLP
jgi:hypothetical protein